MRKEFMYILIITDIAGIGFNICMLATKHGNFKLILLAIVLFSWSILFAINSILSKGKTK